MIQGSSVLVVEMTVHWFNPLLQAHYRQQKLNHMNVELQVLTVVKTKFPRNLLRAFYTENGWKMPLKRRNVRTKPHCIASQYTVSQLTGTRTLAVRT